MVGKQPHAHISPLPALAAELGCSQHFYFKPHNVYEEARGVHGQALQPATEKPCHPQPRKLPLLVPARGQVGPAAFFFPAQAGTGAAEAGAAWRTVKLS